MEGAYSSTMIIDDCGCWDSDAGLPCWPCDPDGFDVPNLSAGEE